MSSSPFTQTMAINGNPALGVVSESSTPVVSNRPNLHQTAILTTALSPREAKAAGAPLEERSSKLRHDVQERLGLGASGEVFAVHDANLQRTVAIKIIPADLATDARAMSQLVAEARITASLSHPNVLPVYDLDMDAGGRAYFSMKRVEGRSLGSAIELSSPTARDEAIASGSRIVNLFIGVTQAMAYAHKQGVVHQDIKPDNIMLGQYGEVLVVDWGSAMRLTPGLQPTLYGTPLYMSPEQARSQNVDARSDVYCIGASLFHALVLRPPTWSEDVDEFWKKKRSGTIDPVTPVEARAAPAVLLSIALKALNPDPEHRYSDGEELLKDLRQYQAGLAVSAHHDSILERGIRFYRYHRRSLWAGSLIALTTLGMLGVLIGEWIDRVASWGHPVQVEDFSNDSWQKRWAPFQGAFERQGSRLVTTGEQANVLMYTTRLSGATAIEYDVMTLPGHPLGDMSAVWCPDLTFSDDHSSITQLSLPYFFQFGSFDASGSEITYEDSAHGRGKITLTYSNVRPVQNHAYHIRVEIADTVMEVRVDGRRILSCTVPFGYQSGYVGIYGHYSGKAFSDIRISTRGISRKLDATALGDVFVEHRDLASAVVEYARVAASIPGSTLGDQALYKEGLCQYQQGHFDKAFSTWQPLRNSSYSGQLQIWDIDHRFEAGDTAGALEQIKVLYPRSSTAQRKLLAQEWWTLAAFLESSGRTKELSAWLQVHDSEFRNEFDCDIITANALISLGRYQEVIERFPELPTACAGAHLALGHFTMVLDQFSNQYYDHDLAAFLVGRTDLINSHTNSWMYFKGALMQGRVGEVLTTPGVDRFGLQGALAYVGRIEEALRIPDPMPFTRSMILCNEDRLSEIPASEHSLALLAEGRLEELEADPKLFDWAASMVHHTRAIRAWRNGDQEEAKRDLPPLVAMPLINPSLIFVHNDDVLFSAVMLPFLKSLAGKPEQFDTGCRYLINRFPMLYQSQLWYAGRYLLGEIDDREFLGQPWRLYAPAELLLLRGMRAEVRGRPSAALEDYRTWLALPKRVRGDFPNPAWIEFTHWRVDLLGGHDRPAPAPAPATGAVKAPRP